MGRYYRLSKTLSEAEAAEILREAERLRKLMRQSIPRGIARFSF